MISLERREGDNAMNKKIIYGVGRPSNGT